MAEDRLERIRNLIRLSRTTFLATQSEKFPGTPFGSVVPAALDGEGGFLLLLSPLAVHYRNIQISDRISLTLVEEGNAPVQSRARLTLLGSAVRTENLPEKSKSLYFSLFPETEMYAKNLGFNFFRFVPEAAYFIGGFGDAGWIEMDSLGLDSM